MNVLSQILVTGLTLGAMYSVAALGLSLIWASFRMLNMAHGAILAVGGYVAFAAFDQLGFPAPISFLIAMLFGGFMGWVMFWVLVKPILSSPHFETNILIVTVGLGIILENSVLQVFGGRPYGQPVSVDGAMSFAGIHFATQNAVILVASIVIVLTVTLLLNRTRLGLALRACAQQRDAAAIVGLPVNNMFAATMAIAGSLTAAAGVMVSSITQLSPLLGSDPMLKAFIICVLAGLGQIGGSVVAAFLLAFVEVGAQYYFGARWGFPTLLFLVIGVLIWCPAGLFSSIEVRRM